MHSNDQLLKQGPGVFCLQRLWSVAATQQTVRMKEDSDRRGSLQQDSDIANNIKVTSRNNSLKEGGQENITSNPLCDKDHDVRRLWQLYNAVEL